MGDGSMAVGVSVDLVRYAADTIWPRKCKASDEIDHIAQTKDGGMRSH